MTFRAIHTNAEQYYAVGVDEDTGQLALEIVMTWVAWYSRFFAISQEEFNWFTTDRPRLDALALSCTGASGVANNRQRFLYSQLAVENNSLLTRVV